jgi:hypothetical protein
VPAVFESTTTGFLGRVVRVLRPCWLVTTWAVEVMMVVVLPWETLV